MSLLLLLRRGTSTPFTPASLSGLSMWLDPTDSATLTLSGSQIVDISDKSGNGNHATQPTAASRPLTGGSINGLNAMIFDGTDDFFNLGAGIAGIMTGAVTAFIVALSDNAGDASQLLMGFGTATTAPRGATIFQTATQLQGYHRTTVAPTNLTFTRNTTPFLACLRRNNGSVRVWGNGGTSAYGSDSEDVTATLGTIGAAGAAANRFDGQIAEIIIYNRALSSAEMNLVNNYLAAKWGLTVAAIQGVTAPSDFGTIGTMARWWDASVASSITVATGVSSWAGLQTGAIAMINATAGEQPPYAAGPPATVTADGNNDRLFTTAGNRVFTAPAAMTIAMRGRLITPSTGTLGFLINEATGSAGWGLSATPAGALDFRWEGATRVQSRTPDSVIDTTQPINIIVTYDGTTNASGIRIYINGTEQTYSVQQNGVTLANASVGTAIGVRSGGTLTGLYTNTAYQRAVMYTEVLSSAALTNLNNFLSTGIQ